uniref:Ephrin RBD domain-containing protein n=1 Tax=Clytia hemisphaerica TaxID=252671 RepID=A0A7M5UMG2_9CNID
MGYHTYKLIICIICLLLCFEWCCVEGLAVIWDPYHPLFSCKDPVVNVKETDLLKFVCPDKDISSKPNAHSSTLHEVAYLLDYTKEQDYANCDARDHLSVLLNCTAAYRTTQHRITQNALSPDAPSFTPGKTYYVIATSFQTSNNINNLVGGSCNYSQDGAHNLKLKIHVCDGSDSSCSVCDNEACLYKDCGKSCGNWTNGYTFKRDGGCFSVEKRLCNNTLLGITNHEEQREVALDCPKTCSAWEQLNLYQKGDNCYKDEIRSCNISILESFNNKEYRQSIFDCKDNCTDLITSSTFERIGSCFLSTKKTCVNEVLNISRTEYNETEVDCPTIVIPTGAPNKGDPGSDDEELYKYMLIPVGAVCLIIGVALGCMGHRYQNVKNRCKNNNVSPEMNHNNGRNRGGVANPSYTPDSVIINDTPEMIRNGGI